LLPYLICWIELRERYAFLNSILARADSTIDKPNELASPHWKGGASEFVTCRVCCRVSDHGGPARTRDELMER